MTSTRAMMTALLGGVVCAFLAIPAFAQVTPEQAEQLKTTLTPLGAERAGNKDAHHPCLDGWDDQANSGLQGRRPAAGSVCRREAAVFDHCPKHDKYADKLSDGTKAMLKKYPTTYRLDVYPTHRTAASPQWLYDNTFKNATRAKALINGPAGLQPDNDVYGGIPYPFPQNGAEVMWNNNLRYRGIAEEMYFTQYVIGADGTPVLTGDVLLKTDSPYYFDKGNYDAGLKDLYGKYHGLYYRVILWDSGPPIRAGQAVLGGDNIDDLKNLVYIYLVGERRVRQLPNACCDTPNPSAAGVIGFDDLWVFSGRLQRFTWKLLGKKEMYIPYNDNGVQVSPKDTDEMDAHFLNPNNVRWELHRVWAVEADLAPGQRDQVHKGIYYVDEDSWMAVLGDRWDASGRLWKTNWILPMVYPDLPAVDSEYFGFYDLISGTWFVSGNMNTKAEQIKVIDKPNPDQLMTPEALAASSVR